MTCSDLQAVAAAGGISSSEGTWNPSADVNFDGYVNVGGLQLQVAHWAKHP